MFGKYLEEKVSFFIYIIGKIIKLIPNLTVLDVIEYCPLISQNLNAKNNKFNTNTVCTLRNRILRSAKSFQFFHSV